MQQQKEEAVPGDAATELAKLVISLFSAAIAIVALVISRRADARSKKAEEVKELLGEKESVAFAALRLLRDGLPSKAEDRRLVISAMMQAAIFERSDRARALLYRVMELNLPKYGDELRSALRMMRDTFDSMDRHQFDTEQFDPGSGRLRIGAIAKVIEPPQSTPG